jgi:hypothetical protein
LYAAHRFKDSTVITALCVMQQASNVTRKALTLSSAGSLRAQIRFGQGKTPFYALGGESRFSYSLYVPERATTELCDLVVVQHGTDRDVTEARDRFIDAADLHGWIILCPLYPANVGDFEGLLNYQKISHNGTRYDEVLLEMVDEVAKHWNLRSSNFILHGFSGGGQFVHRFLYLHPRRVIRASVGAPGHITLLSDQQQWWSGTADMAELFGQSVDLEALSRVPLQVIVGGADVDTSLLDQLPREVWQDNADLTGHTRVERARCLADNWRQNGLDVLLTVVPDVAHEADGVAAEVIAFLASGRGN